MVLKSTTADPLINRTVEGYHFIKRLGEGSFGVVYLARHPRIKDRLVAIKHIKLGDPTQIKKVEREVDILARLNHPNVIHIYDTYRFDHYQLIVMELIRGGNLQDAMGKLKRLLDLPIALEICEQLAFALGYVHSENILHLDLKPANILLDPVAEGQFARCVITDFGIAQIVNPGAMVSTNLVGTPRYMSPEHFGFGDSKPDRRSDVYSLGIILYELIVGRVPFESLQLLELLNQHAYSPVPVPSGIVSYIPTALDAIVLKALAKSPKDRFQTATEMASALRDLRLSLLSSSRQIQMNGTSGEALGKVAQANAEAMSVSDPSLESAPPSICFKLAVMKPDGSQESIGFDKRAIIVGRDKGVDLQLDQSSVSRRHAQIECDRSGNLFVTDLQSSNGTYLDGVRLTPQERVLWKPSQYLEIQGFLLQMDGLPGDQPGTVEPFVFETDVVVALFDELHNQRSKPNVRVSLSPAVVYIEPGKPQYIQVRVSPEHTPVARYELRAKPGPGVNEQWYTLPGGQVINADNSYTFDFIVSAPEVGTIGGRTHEITLEVVADNPEIPSAFEVLKLRIVPVTRFSVSLRPNEVSDNRRRQSELVILNGGNNVETLSIEVQAPDTLQVKPAKSQVMVEPAKEATVRLNFRPSRDARRARSRLVYTLIVYSASGATERASGTYVFRRQGRIPIGLVILWVVAIIVIARLMLFGVPLETQFNQARDLFESLIRMLRSGA